jgi:predicted N-acyltransferase
MSDNSISVKVVKSISELDREEWNNCAILYSADGLDKIEDPFISYDFLDALEKSKSVGENTGWLPYHLAAIRKNKLIGAVPLYLKSNSQGEYIFDYNWAHAFERAGGRYYPKLQISVPFTPVTGRRLLVSKNAPSHTASLLLQSAIELCEKNKLSSLHTTFCSKQEFELGQKLGMLGRVSQQFHWLNNGYGNFGDFLNALSSRKRKNINKERLKANNFGGEIEILTGSEIKKDHWNYFWKFYQDTGIKKWGTPYLTRQFFDQIHETMRSKILLILAKKEGNYIAGALNFIGSDTLFGRYWGCIEDYPFLHFEVCYYRAIEFAIAHGLKKVEAGAQGEHKLARGYVPTETFSLHWIAEKGFSKAVQEYLISEKDAVKRDIKILSHFTPFKKGDEKND